MQLSAPFTDSIMCRAPSTQMSFPDREVKLKQCLLELRALFGLVSQQGHEQATGCLTISILQMQALVL